jgi:hypothetical protein
MSEFLHSGESSDFSLKWKSLSKDAKEAALFLAAAEPRTGVDQQYFVSMGIPNVAQVLEELVNQGFVEVLDIKEIAQQFIDQNRNEVEKIQECMRNDFKYRMSDQERSLLSAFQAEERRLNLSSLRYRFVGDSMEFVKTQFDSEE